MSVIILRAQPQVWCCPNCPVTDRTVGQPNRFHHCSGLAGLYVQMVPAGTKAKVEAREREDYIAGADVQYDSNGRPVMAAVVTREDGEDVTVYAPTAHMKMG